MELLWSKTEQQEIKKISPNVIAAIFDKLAEETQNVDLKNLLGIEFFNDIVANPTNYTDLLEGGTYEYNDITYTFSGLKYVLAYYFYARYLNNAGDYDTFSGIVQHNYDDAQRVGFGAIKSKINEAKEIAANYWDECKHFMSVNSGDYPYFYANHTKRLNYRIL